MSKVIPITRAKIAQPVGLKELRGSVPSLPSLPEIPMIGLRLLLDRWSLTEHDSRLLLGLTESEYGEIKAGGYPENKDMDDRISHLLGIHKALRALYYESDFVCYGWVKMRNRDFKGAFGYDTPLQLMLTGLPGIKALNYYLEFIISQ